MAVFIDVITGFIESGKTTFINKLIERKTFLEYGKTVLVVCEEGIGTYSAEDLKTCNISPVILSESEELTDEWMDALITEYTPDYIIIEYNGTWDIGRLLALRLPKFCMFRNLIHISEAGRFNPYLRNMSSILQPQIINSDLIVFNRAGQLAEENKKQLKSQVRAINPKTETIFEGDQNQLEKYFVPFEKYHKITSGMIIMALTLLFLCLIPFHTLEQIYDHIRSVSTIFLSILMQALPFILLGAFISSGIQLFIPTGWIIRKFSGRKFVSFFFAAIAGFFMPVCDCGLVPIVSGLLKKGTPLPQTMTFWLTSAAVNPIVILSVLYAFPDRPWLAVIRVLAGTVIGILAGVILKAVKIETADVIKNSNTVTVGSSLLTLQQPGTSGKITAVFDLAKIEFFRVTKYVIIGALVSSLFQGILPRGLQNYIGGSMIIQMLIMIAGAIFMSTCSTSNAFIGRSFIGNFALLPVMSFIVLGPMLDFKNLFMLSEVLKKSFLIKLAALVIATALLVFGITGYYL